MFTLWVYVSFWFLSEQFYFYQGNFNLFISANLSHLWQILSCLLHPTKSRLSRNLHSTLLFPNIRPWELEITCQIHWFRDKISCIHPEASPSLRQPWRNFHPSEWQWKENIMIKWIFHYKYLVWRFQICSLSWNQYRQLAS